MLTDGASLQQICAAFREVEFRTASDAQYHQGQLMDADETSWHPLRYTRDAMRAVPPGLGHFHRELP